MWAIEGEVNNVARDPRDIYIAYALWGFPSELVVGKDIIGRVIARVSHGHAATGQWNNIDRASLGDRGIRTGPYRPRIIIGPVPLFSDRRPFETHFFHGNADGNHG